MTAEDPHQHGSYFDGLGDFDDLDAIDERDATVVKWLVPVVALAVVALFVAAGLRFFGSDEPQQIAGETSDSQQLQDQDAPQRGSGNASSSTAEAMAGDSMAEESMAAESMVGGSDSMSGEMGESGMNSEMTSGDDVGAEGPTTITTATVNPEDLVRVVDLKSGDCIRTFSAVEGSDLEAVETIDCLEPHALEVYHAAEPWAGEVVFPDAESVDSVVSEQCVNAFVAYIGTDIASTAYEVWTLKPTPESWQVGDRGMLCLLGAADGTPLTGSAQQAPAN